MCARGCQAHDRLGVKDASNTWNLHVISSETFPPVQYMIYRTLITTIKEGIYTLHIYIVFVVFCNFMTLFQCILIYRDN